MPHLRSVLQDYRRLQLYETFHCAAKTLLPPIPFSSDANEPNSAVFFRQEKRGDKTEATPYSTRVGRTSVE